MTTTTTQALFTPVQVGRLSLSHRVVMAPLTRSRSQQPGDIPSDLMVEYYGQRASKGGLIISEATTISISGRGWFGAPGLYSDEQIAGWQRVLKAVRAKGGYIFSQLWHTGRASHLETTNGSAPVSPSGIPFEGLVSTPQGWLPPSTPRALEITEIPAIIEDYRRAAERAQAAGFEGVELHAANGYLPDQFLQDGTNRRTDAYGGSIENRCRFTLEILQALVSVWGGDRVAVRIGPSGKFNGMSDSDPGSVVRLSCRPAEPVWPRLSPHSGAESQRQHPRR